MTRDSQNFQYLCTYPYAMLVCWLHNCLEKLVIYCTVSELIVKLYKSEKCLFSMYEKFLVARALVLNPLMDI